MSAVERAGGEPLAYVQALRGVAALAVVLYHGRNFIDGPGFLGAGSRLFGGGSAGVDLFFVLSGLIMVHTTRHVAGGGRDALAFLARRFARIWPVYAVALAVMFVYTRWMSGPAFVTNAEQLAKTLVFWPLAPGGQAPFFGYPLLHVGWTLVYEAFFYGLFALALLAGRYRLAALGAGFVGCLVLWPLLAVGRVSFDAQQSYGLGGYAAIATSPLCWDFAMGVGIGLLRDYRPPLRDRGLLATLAVIALGVVLWQQGTGWHAGHGPSRWGVPMAILVLTLSWVDQAAPIRVPRALAWLGDVSFSLYLFHVMPQMLPRVIKDEPQLLGGGGFFVASVLAGLVLAYLGHRYLERGLAEWVRRRLLARLRTTRVAVPGATKEEVVG